MQWVFDTLISMRVQPVQGSASRRTTRGTVTIPKPRVNSQPTSSGMNYRGEWVADGSYKVGDVVLIRDGVSAGLYICVMDAPGSSNPPSLPDFGIYWVCLAKNDTVGEWL